MAAIPYQGTTLNGYLLRPAGAPGGRPVVIAPAGYDSTAEAGYPSAAVAALRHGMNCLMFEGPGQGGVLYEQRLYFRPDYEAVLTPVVDWLLTQPGIGPAGLVLFGRSFGGYHPGVSPTVTAAAAPAPSDAAMAIRRLPAPDPGTAKM